jgi:hypothetical protein
MKILSTLFSAILIAVLPAVWTIPLFACAFAFTTPLSTRTAQFPSCEGSVRLYFGENDAGTSRNDAKEGEISFAAYQESLKRTNGGTTSAAAAAAGSSKVYQDQYGRTIQRPEDNFNEQGSSPMTNLDTATDLHQKPSIQGTAELSDESFMAAITSTSEPAEGPLLQDKPELSERVSGSISTDNQSSNNLGPRRSKVDYPSTFDSFPSQRVGHDRLKPVSRGNFNNDESKSQDSKWYQPTSSTSSRKSSPAADTSSSSRRAVEIMTLTDRMMAFPSQRVGHDRLRPARHGPTTPPTKEDLTDTNSSSPSSSNSPRKTDDRTDKGYVVAHDPAKLSSPFRFLARPDPNFVIDEGTVRREAAARHSDDTHDPNASKSVAPDNLL